MPNTTPNLGLIKPLVTEQYDIAKVTNENADILDSEIQAVKDDVLDKQDTLVSGTSIKTINSTSLLGSGDVTVQPTLVSGTNIKTINSESILGSGDILVQEPLVSSTNIKTIDGVSILGSGDLETSNLVFETEVTGSAVTSIDVTGLDINLHKSYRIEIEFENATASNANISMFINGDFVATNYYSQYMFASGASTPLSARINAAPIAYLDASYKCSGNIHLQKVVGQPMAASTITDNINTTTSANIRTFNLAWGKTATVANINQLTFTSSVASAIGIGSKIRIYKN